MQEVAVRETELMSHEEEVTRQVWRYKDAEERKADYEIYYTLSHVFGILTEEKFDQTPRPGE